MKSTNDENTSRPIHVHVALLDRSTKGIRSARLTNQTCRVTLAPSGHAPRIAELISAVNDGGVILTWAEHEAPQIRAVSDVSEALASTKTQVAVVTNDYELLAPPVYAALASVLRGEEPERSQHHYDSIGRELAEAACILLATLSVPGFE